MKPSKDLEQLLQKLSDADYEVKNEAIKQLKENYEKVIRIRKLARLYHTNEEKIRSILKKCDIKIGN